MGVMLSLYLLIIFIWRVKSENRLPVIEEEYKVYEGAWHVLDNLVLNNQTVGNITIISGHQVESESALTHKFHFENQKDGTARALLDGTNMLINLYDSNKLNKILQLIFQINTFAYVLSS
eukprot:TRINITY_DN959_c0_g2_i10.p1 TRINITY_DN959_c0_g2~~TRINITY_DN959_c0_g2_i10.p1  ORF type:complete len:120 (-),score=21.31 TRINITY_DN959_c0_g2_i10:186-545(-)